MQGLRCVQRKVLHSRFSVPWDAGVWTGKDLNFAAWLLLGLGLFGTIVGVACQLGDDSLLKGLGFGD